MKTSFRPFKEISKTTAEAQWQPYTAAARRFALDWALEADKKGEAHSCWDEIMLIFNIRRRNFTRYEARAKRSNDRPQKLISCNFKQFRYNVDKLGKAVKPLEEVSPLATSDLFIAMTGAIVGKIGIMPRTETTLYLNQHVGIIKPKTEIAELFLFCFNEPLAKNAVERFAS